MYNRRKIKSNQRIKIFEMGRQSTETFENLINEFCDRKEIEVLDIQYRVFAVGEYHDPEEKVAVIYREVKDNPDYIEYKPRRSRDVF